MFIYRASQSNSNATKNGKEKKIETDKLLSTFYGPIIIMLLEKHLLNVIVALKKEIRL